MISLLEFAARYADTRSISTMYAYTLQRRATALQEHARESSIDRVLQEPPVNAFLGSLTCSPYTIRGYRGDILSLWNAAADVDLVPYPNARRIRRPSVPDLLVECYAVEEAREILTYAKTMRGAFHNGIAYRKYWAAAIPLAWEAGFRRGDVWRFKRDAVRRDGTLRILQHKTKNVVVVRLRQSTLDALDSLDGNTPCSWPLVAAQFGRHWQKIVKAAGVKRGTFKWLRRASGSYVEMLQPGTGHKHLGHKHRSTFDKFYDAQLGAHLLPMPPEL